MLGRRPGLASMVEKGMTSYCPASREDTDREQSRDEPRGLCYDFGL